MMRAATLKQRNYKSQTTNHKLQDRGYILISLMLFVALLSIAALAVLPAVKQQIKRDREEELQDRGTAYMRAIQHFYKKFGRYPSRIEDLENTNNIRFLRKRYKDPMNRDPKTHKEKDFRVLHMQDINLYTGQAAEAGGIGLTGGQPGQSFGQNPSPAQFGGAQNQPNGQPQSHTLANNAPNAAAADESDAGDGSGDTANNGQNQNNPNPANPGAASGGPLGANPANGNNPQVFGGGPIVGVASASKDKSIREFGDKYKHYNDWLFIYDPTSDRGGLLKGPVVPNKGARGGMGTPAGTVANQSQGGPGGAQPQNPAPQPQPPQNPQMPPEQ